MYLVLTILMLIMSSFNLNGMHLEPYDIPYDRDSEQFPGGAIQLQQGFKKIPAGTIISVYALLNIEYTDSPSIILDKWRKLYQKFNNDEDNLNNTTILEAAQRLSLPIPPEPRDTSNTPNYDAFLARYRQTILDNICNKAIIHIEESNLIKNVPSKTSDTPPSGSCTLV
ncbi:MAG: hypothetical protein WD068_03230 [Candidatus Babeliales bacterium]